MKPTQPTDPAFKQPRDGFTLQEIADRLGVCVRTLRRLADKGEFPKPRPLAGRRIVPAAEYKKFLAKWSGGSQ